MNRFQEYAPNYLAGERETDLIDKSKIGKIPISMLVGIDDKICSHDKAKKDAELIGDAVVHFESIENADHAYFGYANDEFYMNLVKSQLEIPNQNDGAILSIAATLTSIAIGLSVLVF